VREKNAMRAVSSLVVAVLSLVVFAAPSVVLADGRVALVVGNSTYAHIGRLPNPDNDARDMSGALRRLGFEVTTEVDADRVELTEALRAFTRKSAGADVSVVFYAGHGIEMDGVNYLVPVDARLERDVDVRFETVTVDDLLVSTTGASLRLVILDACRNNPLARSMQRTAATRTVSRGSFADLNEDLLGDETLVAYAAAAGTTAADGRGRNSPYTAALLSHLETPLEIGLLFRRVRAQVLAATNGAQRPHEYHSLVGEHYLTRTLATGAAVTVSAATAADPAPVDPSRLDASATDVTELPFAALRELAEAGDAAAQTELGERYEDGRDVVQDYGVAVSWFRRAAEQGYAPGQAALGFMYERGRGVVQDSAEAARWYRRSAEQGNTRAQNNLGSSYATGLGVAQNDRAAVEWYRRAAEQGWPPAQRNLGEMYETGRGVTRDERQAASWYRRAVQQFLTLAKLGDSDAQFTLGNIYLVGQGVAQSDRSAVAWFRRAADQGQMGAQHNLGWMYLNGRGVSQDYDAALAWIRRAAEQGEAYAQNTLGWMYENGRGVRRDRVEAVGWYRLAAEQGHADAQKALDRLR
jgi:TPR repeat protein